MTVILGDVGTKGVGLYADRLIVTGSCGGRLSGCKLRDAGRFSFGVSGFFQAMDTLGAALAKIDRIEELAGAVDMTHWEQNSVEGGPRNYDFQALITDGDKLWRMAGDFSCVVTEGWAAVGSGADAALGALLAGAPPVRALEIASEVNVYCGGGYDHLFRPRSRRRRR